MKHTIWLNGTTNPIQYYFDREAYLIDGEIVTQMEILENPDLGAWVKNQKVKLSTHLYLLSRSAIKGAADS